MKFKTKLIALILGFSSVLATSTTTAQPTGYGTVDLIFGTAERVAPRSISGGYSVGFNYPCANGICSHIEFANGDQWISGDVQSVPGGNGCLTGAGREPVGRHPYGSAYKVVLRNLNEQTDTAQVWRYTRTCNWCGCTPYSFPGGIMGTWSPGQQVFIGL